MIIARLSPVALACERNSDFWIVVTTPLSVLGQFVPGNSANPTIGERGKTEYVEEDRVEFIVNDPGDKSALRKVVDELRMASTVLSKTMHVLKDILGPSI